METIGLTLLSFVFATVWFFIDCAFKAANVQSEPNPVIPFRGTPQNTGSSAQEIETKILSMNQVNDVKNLSREFKVSIYSEYDKKYMPKS